MPDKASHIEEPSDSSGIIFGVLDPLSNEFTNYHRLPTRNSSSYNCFYVAQRAGRYYVLKGLNPAVANDPVFEEWLAKEYQIGIQLDHPNIVRINSFEDNPVVGKCIVMEFVDGLNLNEWLAKKPSAQQRKEVFRQLLSALSYCHNKQIWHRDIKPSNILITNADNMVKLIDFGLADSSQYAFLKQSAGTRGYAAPEQLAGLPANHRADIYALGGILKLLFPHRYHRAVRHTQRTDPDKRPQSVAQVNKMMRPRWIWLLLPILLIGLFCLWMRPTGKCFPVTLDSGQTVYCQVLSHWHRTVAIVAPDSSRMSWETRLVKPSGDMVIPSHIQYRHMPYRVIEIGKSAFYKCNEIRHLTLPEGLIKIGINAFYSCSDLCDTLVLPSTLQIIDNEAFSDCFSITTLVWKASNMTTPGYDKNIKFYRCNMLKKAIVDTAVKQLPPCAFASMLALEDIELPNDMRSLPNDFASEAYSLHHIKLPDSLEIINHGAFYYSGLDEIRIPDATHTLEGYCFSYCGCLRTVDIGRGIKKIKSYALNRNKVLETVIIRSEEPPILYANAFFEIPEKTVLRVPASALEKYRKHPDWQMFKRIEAIEE